jgi:hypothetical protein
VQQNHIDQLQLTIFFFTIFYDFYKFRKEKKRKATLTSSDSRYQYASVVDSTKYASVSTVPTTRTRQVVETLNTAFKISLELIASTDSQ